MSHPPDAVTLEQFFRALYEAMEEGWLILSSPDPAYLTPQGKPALRSTWFDLARASWPQIARAAAHRARTTTVYHSVVVQHPDCQPSPWRRSKAGTAYQVPGLWFDLDLAYGRHAAATLPQTDAQALTFLERLPAPPSLIVHSGGGLYGWWLFREPFVITTADEREEIARLSKQFTATLVAAGTLHGWTLDALGDLARVLRPPGSLNTKYGKLVTLLQDRPVRYDPGDFDWLIPLPAPAPHTPQGPGVAGQPNLLIVAEHYGVTLSSKSATELAGAHPVHGSSTSTNFNINVAKGVWHCWRHGTGGDALLLIAVCEGLLDCTAARSGTLTGDIFRRVLHMAQVLQASTGPSLRERTQIVTIPLETINAREVPPWH
jgi:hypothetical protein